MAQKVQVEKIDDIDGTPADETILFGIDGHSYEIDLSPDNAKALREGLGEWVAAARKAGVKLPATRKSVNNSEKAQRSRAIREWAKGAGYELPERGRISVAVVTAYENAHAE
jgi:hypothetical protein